MAKAKESPPDEVRAAYRRHDEEESNPFARELFQSNPPTLDDVQQHVVDNLATHGYCLLPITDLVSVGQWDQLEADSNVFIRSMEDQLQGGTTPVKVKKIKEPKPGKVPKPGKEKAAHEPKPVKQKFFLGRRYKNEPLGLSSAGLQLAMSTRILDIVNSYLGMWSKISYVDQWYSPPRGSEADRLGSMRWHRDYNDQHLVKVFTYMVDVDEGTGPLEYVVGSARNGPYSSDWPWDPVGETYPPDEEFQARVSPSAVRTFTGPKGSIIFANTSGFHRGGYATKNPRCIWVFNYVSPAGLAALVDRNFEIAPDELAGRSDVERYALL